MKLMKGLSLSLALVVIAAVPRASADAADFAAWVERLEQEGQLENLDFEMLLELINQIQTEETSTTPVNWKLYGWEQNGSCGNLEIRNLGAKDLAFIEANGGKVAAKLPHKLPQMPVPIPPPLPRFRVPVPINAEPGEDWDGVEFMNRMEFFTADGETVLRLTGERTFEVVGGCGKAPINGEHWAVSNPDLVLDLNGWGQSEACGNLDIRALSAKGLKLPPMPYLIPPPLPRFRVSVPVNAEPDQAANWMEFFTAGGSAIKGFTSPPCPLFVAVALDPMPGGCGRETPEVEGKKGLQFSICSSMAGGSPEPHPWPPDPDPWPPSPPWAAKLCLLWTGDDWTVVPCGESMIAKPGQGAQRPPVETMKVKCFTVKRDRYYETVCV